MNKLTFVIDSMARTGKMLPRTFEALQQLIRQYGTTVFVVNHIKKGQSNG